MKFSGCNKLPFLQGCQVSCITACSFLGDDLTWWLFVGVFLQLLGLLCVEQWQVMFVLKLSDFNIKFGTSNYGQDDL